MIGLYLFQKVVLLCVWLIDITFGELKSSQICQSGEHDIEFSANPVNDISHYTAKTAKWALSPAFYP